MPKQSSTDSRWLTAIAAPVAGGAVAGVAAATLLLLRRSRRSGDPVRAGSSEGAARTAGADLAATTGVAHQPISSPLNEPVDAEGVATQSFDLKRAVAQRPGVSIAITAVVVAVLTAATVVLTIGSVQPTNVSQPAHVTPALIEPKPNTQPRQQRIPAASSAEACRDCPDKTGQRFTLEFSGPWMVTQVGFRPLELVPGRRVTKLRWELNSAGRDTSSISQTEDSPGDGHDLTWTQLRGPVRTWEVSAVVEESIPADNARLADSSVSPPLVAYGSPAPEQLAKPVSDVRKPSP